MSGLSLVIGWPACASGLPGPSISILIYSLAASRMIHLCDSFFLLVSNPELPYFMLYEIPRGYSAITCSHTEIKILPVQASYRMETAVGIILIVIIKHPSFYFHRYQKTHSRRTRSLWARKSNSVDRVVSTAFNNKVTPSSGE